jgi:hypothetical protein
MQCQGNCNDDSECAGGLECFRRNMATTKSVPGCHGIADNGTDYCYDPDDLPLSQRVPILQDKGFNWMPAEEFPLGLCEGDCDADSDCEGELVCFQRYGNRPVPSCRGNATFDTDYCIRPEDDIDSVPPVPGAFRLKLYWERGYEWQMQFWEQEWCMRCGNVTCNEFDFLYTYTCTGKSTWFQFYNLTNHATNVRVAQTSLCIEIDVNNDARLLPCDTSEPRQRFSPGNGHFNTKRFQLRMQDWCLANDHHPKQGEQLFMQQCYKTVYSQTNFWSKY